MDHLWIFISSSKSSASFILEILERVFSMIIGVVNSRKLGNEFLCLFPSAKDYI